MSAVPIWQDKRLTVTQHRIVWWMLGVQIAAGRIGGCLGYGWQKQCARQMPIDRVWLFRNLKKLQGLGVVERVGVGRFRFNKAVFGSPDPRHIKFS